MSTRKRKDFNCCAYCCAYARVASSRCSVSEQREERWLKIKRALRLFFHSPFLRSAPLLPVTFSCASWLKPKLKKITFQLLLQEGVYIYGLYLDGAGWDRRGCKLIEPQPKVLFTLLPVVHVYAVNSTAPKDPRLYQCPVYKKPQRTDLTYITPLWLKTVQSPDHWILRGVALLCDIKWIGILTCSLLTFFSFKPCIAQYWCAVVYMQLFKRYRERGCLPFWLPRACFFM